jgi:excisionase family DNA binding protein
VINRRYSHHAAAKIGCSLPKVYELIAAGKLRSYHIGRAHRVSEQAIADCIALLEQEDTQERIWVAIIWVPGEDSNSSGKSLVSRPFSSDQRGATREPTHQKPRCGNLS